ncbi:hypothetical protein ACVIJ6_001141 [Bradyrhizobium sp. USDA 4369]
MEDNRRFTPSISIALYPKSCSTPRIPSHRGGASRSSRTSGAGCGGRIGSQRGLARADERSRCDDEVAWFWHRGADAKQAVTNRLRRGQDSRSPGRSRISRNTIAQGRSEVAAEPVVTAACFLVCRRAMGEASSRPSLRPHCFRGRRMSQSSGGKCAARTDLHVTCRLLSRRAVGVSHPQGSRCEESRVVSSAGLALRDARLRRAPQGEEGRLCGHDRKMGPSSKGTPRAARSRDAPASS